MKCVVSVVCGELTHSIQVRAAAVCAIVYSVNAFDTYAHHSCEDIDLTSQWAVHCQCKCCGLASSPPELWH